MISSLAVPRIIRSPHRFHIPVMGSGHSIDTPIRVAHLGINSVVSLVDDLLCERIRKHYCEKYSLPYQSIPRNVEDGRALRITAFLEATNTIVQKRFNDTKSLPLATNNEKGRYFKLLPDASLLKQKYVQWTKSTSPSEKAQLEKELTDGMVAGSIDVNIMVKLDRLNYDSNGKIMSEEFSDAKAALRGFARSSLTSNIVFSAGINQTLFTYMSEFPDFYRNANGIIKKKIILKVSDFRSSLTQGRYLARKGLEIFEYRIESGLNCGGHAFPSDGELLPVLLEEIAARRSELVDSLKPQIVKYYEKKGLKYPDFALTEEPLVTVQGGIGHFGEAERLYTDYNMDMTGWASPFLLVPEATCIDDITRKLLIDSGEEDYYLSDISPLGVPFNHVRGTGSEIDRLERIAKGKPGSPCPKKFLVSNNEYTELPICTASAEYQELKIAEIEQRDLTPDQKQTLINKMCEKSCICDHLGNGALIALGILPAGRAPQAICPGPNLAWMNREYSLEEMIDHIYGRIESLMPPERPHMFAKEIEMYVDYFEKILAFANRENPKDCVAMDTFYQNMLKGLDANERLSVTKPYRGENLASLALMVKTQRPRMESFYQEWKTGKMHLAVV